VLANEIIEVEPKCTSKHKKKNSVMTEENKVNGQTRKGLCSIIIKLNIGL